MAVWDEAFLTKSWIQSLPVSARYCFLFWCFVFFFFASALNNKAEILIYGFLCSFVPFCLNLPLLAVCTSNLSLYFSPGYWSQHRFFLLLLFFCFYSLLRCIDKAYPARSFSFLSVIPSLDTSLLKTRMPITMFTCWKKNNTQFCFQVGQITLSSIEGSKRQAEPFFLPKAGWQPHLCRPPPLLSLFHPTCLGHVSEFRKAECSWQQLREVCVGQGKAVKCSKCCRAHKSTESSELDGTLKGHLV